MAVMKLKKGARVSRKPIHKSLPRAVTKVANERTVAKKVKRKSLVIAQEIKFARLLANNDKKVRDKMLKNLKKWLSVRSDSSFPFTESDFMRLWKGLFYCMWMSDKPLIQEELAESLSNVVHCFDSMETAMLYTKCTLKTLAIEWYGIDQYRIDKFQMLVRRIIRQTFEMCRRQSWDEEWTQSTAKVIETILLDPKTSLGFSLHVTELYMEELAKIGRGGIPPSIVTELLRPFAVHLAAMEDERQIRHVMKHIFRYLIFQSDVGMDYMEKFEAWRQAGFPCKHIDEMQKVEISDNECESEDLENDDHEKESDATKALDPRAGRVDVELPQLPFDPLEIAELIKEYKFHPKSTAKTRRQIMRLIREFTELSKGNMPLGVKEVVLPRRKNPETNPKKAAYRLLEFEKDLYSDTIRRRRKRKQAALENEGEEGFENLLEPEAFQTNGFQNEDDDSDDEPLETKDSETLHISQKKFNKKGNKKVSLPSVLSKKSIKKQKKLKINEKLETETVDAKVIKIKSKKSKTKKFQSAIKSSSQKVLNRSSEESTSKPKKARLSIDAWDVSTNVDQLSPTVSPKSAESTVSSKACNVCPVLKISETEQQSSNKTLPNPLPKDQMMKIPWLHPVLTKLEDEKPKQVTPQKSQSPMQSGSSTKKRVKIVLRRNTAQATSEYFRQLRQSPQIPYDANRKPLAGVLKPSPLSSPVNPFYRPA